MLVIHCTEKILDDHGRVASTRKRPERVLAALTQTTVVYDRKARRTSTDTS